jgi:hypothetical protein
MDDIGLPEKAWREIEATLGMKEPNLAVRGDIARYVYRHLSDAQFGPPPLRRSVQRKWITRIRANAQRLVTDLDWEAIEDESDDAWAQMLAAHDLLGADEAKMLLPLLKEVLARADKLLARLPRDKGGKLADPFAWGLVYDLACFYEWATERRPTITYNDYGNKDGDHNEDGNAGRYESPFLDFVAAVLRVFAPDRAKENIALGKHLERVLKVWRRHRA